MKPSTVLASVLIVAMGLCCAQKEATPTAITVAAAASLRDLLEQSAPKFEAAYPGTRLRFSFEASSTLARQIEAGGDYQVFLSADPDNVEKVRRQLDAASIAPFLSNTLALVAANATLAEKVKSPEDLRSQTGKISLAGPKVPVGKYARAYLTKKGLLAELEPRIVTADDVRASLAMVEAGSTDFAFVYLTDAKIAKKSVLLWTAKGADDPGIVYVGGVVGQSPSPIATQYFAWVRSPEFLTLAEPFGFLPPPKP
jgi:molybdate transport system substrate-binding protein